MVGFVSLKFLFVFSISGRYVPFVLRFEHKATRRSVLVGDYEGLFFFCGAFFDRDLCFFFLFFSFFDQYCS
jgi:hypothetical protein